MPSSASLFQQQPDQSRSRAGNGNYFTYFDQEGMWYRNYWVCTVSMVWSQSQSQSVVSDSSWPHGLYSPWNSPGQNTGVGSLYLLQGIFPTQGSNPGLPNCRQILYQLSHKGSPLRLFNSRDSTAGSPDPSICMLLLQRRQQPLPPAQGDRTESWPLHLPLNTSLQDPVHQLHRQKEYGPHLSFQLPHRYTEETVML